ncbi:hypothetical protein [Rhizobium sp. CF080]|uniref:hypothetical protein n=1 Tax=Rhizobium sp. (strain CF080) TaxID=1144310 RepID=UPI0012DF36F7|nr:hypothetical protein [Rhizobium sp. CF080]
MNIQTIIDNLVKANGPDRKLDFAIASLVGYERKNVSTDGLGEQGARIVYVRPPSDEPVKVPDFTRSIDAAYALAQVIVPLHVGAFTWRGNIIRAKINDGPACDGATPALALCIAALKHKATFG